jgi:hypothetical protein
VFGVGLVVVLSKGEVLEVRRQERGRWTTIYTFELDPCLCVYETDFQLIERKRKMLH